MATFDTRDLQAITDTSKRLVQDKEYYRYIFKKTEKIVSVVFYIMYRQQQDERVQLHTSDIQTAAQRVHNMVITSLDARVQAAVEPVRDVALALIALESKLSVAHTAGVLSGEVMQLFSSEIDTVLRAMNRYIGEESDLSLAEDEPMESRGRQQKRTAQTPQQPTREQQASPPHHKAQPETPQTVNRRERITTILEAKGEAGIKAISDIITECSEKTIQRELNAMIKDGTVERRGERRWSTYSLV